MPLDPRLSERRHRIRIALPGARESRPASPSSADRDTSAHTPASPSSRLHRTAAAVLRDSIAPSADPCDPAARPTPACTPRSRPGNPQALAYRCDLVHHRPSEILRRIVRRLCEIITEPRRKVILGRVNRRFSRKELVFRIAVHDLDVLIHAAHALNQLDSASALESARAVSRLLPECDVRPASRGSSRHKTYAIPDRRPAARTFPPSPRHIQHGLAPH